MVQPSSIVIITKQCLTEKQNRSMKVLTLLYLFFPLTCFSQHPEMYASTSEGDIIGLYNDGTWKNIKDIHRFKCTIAPVSGVTYIGGRGKNINNSFGLHTTVNTLKRKDNTYILVWQYNENDDIRIKFDGKLTLVTNNGYHVMFEEPISNDFGDFGSLQARYCLYKISESDYMKFRSNPLEKIIFTINSRSKEVKAVKNNFCIRDQLIELGRINE